jgi:dual oxidase
MIAIGHLTGSFLYSSRPAQREAVIAAVGVQRSYREYASLLPGWTGITALGTFYLIALLSLPIIRKKHYEIFQLGHLLMYPFIGLVCAHGALGLLQYPMLGFWLIIPALLILVERCVRVSYGFHNIPAKLEVLDADTVAITVVVPQKRYWKYRAGQWVFITVPELSIFQWHPFTISTCIGHDMQLHIKTDGDWTSGLRKLAGDGGVANIKICVDGPFGAPAQRFYEFDYTMIIGSGIGVTPFSGILTDLQAREERYQQHLPHVSTQTHIGQGESTPHASNPTEKPPWQTTEAPVYRRVDFHWIVKDKNYLLWFSNLLNSISRSTLAERADDVPHLDVRLQTHVTQKRKNISTHVYRYLLELHRTVEHPESPITGLINETHFGRPSLAEIMDEHYESMLQTIRETKEKGLEIRKRRVGVFFCGAPPIGSVCLKFIAHAS